jgi:hypothetical protein
MENAWKQLFFGLIVSPHVTCSLCSSNELDTWKNVLLSYTQQHLHALQIKQHNKAVWELCKLILSSQNMRCYILMNAGIYNNSPPDNTVPTWLLPCTYNKPRCHCNVCFKPDLLCIIGLPYQHQPPAISLPTLTIQFIEFTFCNDRFL